MPRPRHRRLALSAILAPLLAIACAQGPERIVERRTSDAPMPRGDMLLRQSALDIQNAARAAVGVPPLVWDDALVASAARYAREMAATGHFAHAPQPIGGPLREGENLWTGTRDAYAYAEMVNHWVDERRYFVNGVTPAFSRTGRWQDVSHYAQIVWRGTSRMGCALASGRRDDFLVCRYAPAGNVVGKRSY